MINLAILSEREGWHTLCPLSVTVTLVNHVNHFPLTLLQCHVVQLEWQFEKMWLAGLKEKHVNLCPGHLVSVI